MAARDASAPRSSERPAEPGLDRFWRRVLIVAGVAVLVAALYVARRALVLLYLALLLAIALSPAVRVLERWVLRPIGRIRLPRTLAILVLYLGVLGCMAGIGFLVARPVIEQAGQLWQDLPRLVERVQGLLVEYGVLETAPSWQDVFQQAPGQRMLSAVTATGLGIIGGLFGTIALVVLTFYLLVESRSLFEQALRFVPDERRPRLRQAAVAITEKVSAWLAGQIVLGVIVGTTTALVLGLLGVPYYYVLAVLAFVGEFFPYIGPLFAAVPGVLIGLATSWSMALQVGVFFLVQQQLENHILVPQVFERRVGLSAVTVLVAIVVGAELAGLLGVILAVPTAAIVQVIVDELVLADRDG